MSDHNDQRTRKIVFIAVVACLSVVLGESRAHPSEPATPTAPDSNKFSPPVHVDPSFRRGPAAPPPPDPDVELTESPQGPQGPGGPQGKQETANVYILASPPTSQVVLVLNGKLYSFGREPPEVQCDLRFNGACYWKDDAKFAQISKDIISINGGELFGCSLAIIPDTSKKSGYELGYGECTSKGWKSAQNAQEERLPTSFVGEWCPVKKLALPYTPSFYRRGKCNPVGDGLRIRVDGYDFYTKSRCKLVSMEKARGSSLKTTFTCGLSKQDIDREIIDLWMRFDEQHQQMWISAIEPTTAD